jgi:tRNA(adenine34) deaminase
MSLDEAFMQQALALAREAAGRGGVPVGALAVHDGKVIGTGFNRREIDRNPLAHAEIFAMDAAAKALNAWRLTGVTLYVTLEPCAMCAGALVQSRVTRLVFGTPDPKAGAVGSLYNLAEEPRHNHRLQVTSGIMADESRQVLKDFFERLRAKKRDK